MRTTANQHRWTILRTLRAQPINNKKYINVTSPTSSDLFCHLWLPIFVDCISIEHTQLQKLLNRWDYVECTVSNSKSTLTLNQFKLLYLTFDHRQILNKSDVSRTCTDLPAKANKLAPQHDQIPPEFWKMFIAYTNDNYCNITNLRNFNEIRRHYSSLTRCESSHNRVPYLKFYSEHWHLWLEWQFLCPY